MPYTVNNPPAAVKGLPDHAVAIFVAAFNAAFEQYKGDESKCFPVAWAAVENKYRKDKDGNWVAKESAEFVKEGGPGSGPQGGNGGGTGKSGKEWHGSLNASEKSHISNWQGENYSDIRQAEVGIGDKASIERAREFNVALDKDGNYAGTTYRGISNLDDKDYNSIVGSETLEWKASSSASKDIDMAREFTRGRADRKSVLFKIEGKTGVDISGIGEEKYGEEGEVILRKGTRYKVVSRNSGGANLTYVTLKEV